MVGALADWFAVTALFRHPLGLPIPHTAIIPDRKDQIGRSLGEFVEANFLSPEPSASASATPRSAAALGDVAGRARPRRPGRRRPRGRAAQPALGARRPRRQRASSGSSGAASTRWHVAPLAARTIEVVLDGGHHQRLLDAAAAAGARPPRRAPRPGARPAHPGPCPGGCPSRRPSHRRPDPHRRGRLPGRPGDRGRRPARPPLDRGRLRRLADDLRRDPGAAARA